MNNKYVLKIFCKNVKYLRITNNLSRRTMAKKLGVGVITLMLVEKGIVPKWRGANTLILIHRHFGILPSEMFIDKC
ncbi:MAG: helix-turn-helix transcriptional regulator [Ruminococcaceae bacterium]|nr:helix-turn-helix transcriptional regulator [Oscillospiraceae bacterium]